MKNFNKTYEGAVPARECLTRSLNIPMVYLLQQYGAEKFRHTLQQAGFDYVKGTQGHYGLSLILGGAEVSLAQLNRAYTAFALYLMGRQPLPDVLNGNGEILHPASLHRAALYTTFQAMQELNRPDEEGNWRLFESAQPIAWKTGTSFGNRDAWAVGITPRYVVSVWVGNASGEGRPSLTGIKAAAPLLFELFSRLPHSANWFSKPEEEYTRIAVCHESGYRAGEFCLHPDTLLMPQSCLRVMACPYHRQVFVDAAKKMRLQAEDSEPGTMTATSYFVLPPLMQKYYLPRHPEYQPLPPFKHPAPHRHDIQIIYPKPGSRIYIPVEGDGHPGKFVAEAVCSHPGDVLYWHIDDEYIGQTTAMHQWSLYLEAGTHVLTLMNENGDRKSVPFEVMAH